MSFILQLGWCVASRYHANTEIKEEQKWFTKFCFIFRLLASSFNSFFCRSLFVPRTLILEHDPPKLDETAAMAHRWWWWRNVAAASIGLA